VVPCVVSRVIMHDQHLWYHGSKLVEHWINLNLAAAVQWQWAEHCC